MRYLINNLLESATITPNEPNSSFPAANLYSDILTERTEFDNTVLIDLGSTESINAVAYSNNSDAITLEGNSTDSWGAPAFSQVLTEEVTFIDESYRYWRINTGQTDSRVGYFYLGNYLQLPPHESNSIKSSSTTDIFSITSGRAIFNTPGIVYNEESVNCSLVTESEYNTFEAWWRTRDRARNHFYVPFEEDIANCTPYFARITEYNPGRDQNAYNFSLTFTEGK